MEKLVSRKKLHRLVVVIDIDRATYSNHTHLLNWSHWKPAGRGDHGVSVFWKLCGVCCGCVWCLGLSRYSREYVDT